MSSWVSYLSQGRVNIEEELALDIPAGMLAKVGFIPAEEGGGGGDGG